MNIVVLDQVMFSAGSAALSIAVARTLPNAADFGRFGLVILVGAAFQGIIRSAGFFEYIRSNSREFLDDCIGATRLVSFGAGLLSIGLVWVVVGGAADAAIAGVGVAAVGLHESLRLLAIRDNHARLALLSEVAWVLPAVVLLLVSIGLQVSVDQRAALIAYALSGALGLVPLLTYVVRGSVVAGARSLRRRSQTFLLNSLEQSLGSLGSVALIAAIAWSVSQATAGEVRVGLVLVGPAAVVVQGLATAVAMQHAADTGYRRVVIGSLLVTAGTFSAAALISTSDEVRALLRTLVGESFQLDYLTPVVLLVGGEATLIVLAGALRSQGRALFALATRGATALAGLCAGLIGSRYGIGLVGVVLAVAAAVSWFLAMRVRSVGTQRLDGSILQADPEVNGTSTSLSRRLEQDDLGQQ